jgi:hypothetical protein
VSTSAGNVHLQSVGAQFTLTRRTGSGPEEVPVLAYTIDPVVVFRQPGGESVSGHVTSLLSIGFQLSTTADLSDHLQAAVHERG